MSSDEARVADVIVVGLGVLGSACLYQLAQRGVRVLGVDRFHPPHDQGSSHGETRITRAAVGEGMAYAPLALRSHEIWRELEAQTGERLMLACGVLNLGPPGGAARMHGRPDFVAEAARVAQAFGVPHEVLDAAEISARWPAFTLRGDELGCWEPGGGALFPERCVAAQLAAAQRHGAAVRLGETVLDIDEDGFGVRVRTSEGELTAGRVIVCAGAWTGALVGRSAGAAALDLRIQPQAMHWFETQDPARFTPERFPVFIWLHGQTADGGFYGFPIVPGAPTPHLKVAAESEAAVARPEERDLASAAALAQVVYDQHVRGRLAGVGPRAVRSASCLYTTTADSGFVIGELGAHARVTLASACSGHGFKHAAALGEALARRILGEASPLLEPFDVRLRVGSSGP